MTKVSKYSNYTIDDFVEDSTFRRWVVAPNELLNSFWINFQKDFPDRRNDIILARQIVESLSFEEKDINPQQFEKSFYFLEKHLHRKKRKQQKIRNFYMWVGKIAAVFLIPLLLVCIYLYNNNVSIHTGQVVRYIVPNGQKSRVILADGTKVWLNSGSCLSYPLTSCKRLRKVHLSGEAFFDVAKDKKIPFLVETRDYTIKVYGTKFNVRAYSDSPNSETILQEGSVSVLTKNCHEIKMKASQRFFYSKKGKYNFNLSKVNPDLYLSWKDNVLKISNERLEDLIIRMERWYGVHIHVEDLNRYKDLRYTLTIKTESLREMIDLMKYVTPFEYKINGEDVILNYKTLPMM